MSTPHSIPRSPRFRTQLGTFRIGLATIMAAVGVFIAIAIAITFIALTGANHTTAATVATPSRAAAAAGPHVAYLGPRQQSARSNPQTAQIHNDGASRTNGASNPAPHYTCLGAAHHCLP